MDTRLLDMRVPADKETPSSPAPRKQASLYAFLKLSFARFSGSDTEDGRDIRKRMLRKSGHVWPVQGVAVSHGH